MKRMLCFILMVSFLMISGCSSKAPSYSVDFFAMDTFMSITAYGKNAQQAVEAARDYVYNLESYISKTDETSDIFKINNGEVPQLSEDTEKILAEAALHEKETGGAFNPRLYDLVSLWGIGTEHARIPTDEEISAALAEKRYDLGGIGKGFAANEVTAILHENGVTDALVALGGNVYAVGQNPEKEKPWRTAIKDPDDASTYIGYLDVVDQSVVTSGDYERFFEENGLRYHHIFDPTTGQPVHNNLRSVTIVSADSSLADCYSTALFVMGLEDGLAFCKNRQDFGVVFVTTEKKVYVTDNLKDKFTLTAEDRGYQYG